MLTLGCGRLEVYSPEVAGQGQLAGRFKLTLRAAVLGFLSSFARFGVARFVCGEGLGFPIVAFFSLVKCFYFDHCVTRQCF